MNQIELIKLYRKYLDCFDFFSGTRPKSVFVSYEEADEVLLDYCKSLDITLKLQHKSNYYLTTKLRVLSYKHIKNVDEYELFIKNISHAKDHYFRKRIKIKANQEYFDFIDRFKLISESGFFKSYCNFKTIIDVINFIDLQKLREDLFVFRTKELSYIEIIKLIIVSNQVGISYPISYTDLADYYLKLKRDNKVNNIDEYIYFFEDLFSQGKDSTLDIIKINIEKKSYYYPNFTGDISIPIEGDIELDDYWTNRLTNLFNLIEKELST